MFVMVETRSRSIRRCDGWDVDASFDFSGKGHHEAVELWYIGSRCRALLGLESSDTTIDSRYFDQNSCNARPYL